MITGTVGLVTVTCDATNASVTVKSLGAPISERALPCLFDPHGRYSSHTKDDQKRSEGVGLGLFIAAQIVHGHGGKIEVESTLAGGTIFRVSLPVT